MMKIPIVMKVSRIRHNNLSCTYKRCNNILTYEFKYIPCIFYSNHLVVDSYTIKPTDENPKVSIELTDENPKVADPQDFTNTTKNDSVNTNGSSTEIVDENPQAFNPSDFTDSVVIDVKDTKDSTTSIETIPKPKAFDLDNDVMSVDSMDSVEEREEKKQNEKDKIDELYAPVHAYLKPGK